MKEGFALGVTTVALTASMNLCTSCGVCKSVCPKASISYRRTGGLYLPEIDAATCISCGLCAAVCPGLGHHYEPKDTAAATITGEVKRCYNAWSKDADLRHVSASGGVVSTMVKNLLQANVYDVAFSLDTYHYQEQLKTQSHSAEDYTNDWNDSALPKSRYLPVSHENALEYIKANRTARVIFIGTSCAIRGLQAVIRKWRLDKTQYLFIGLFCDNIFNYNVISYFEDTYCEGASLQALHFKNKESGGWPGDMKLFPKNGEPFFRPLSDRAKAKAYFMPERCLYCVDKLNVCADISVGDNYTKVDDSPLGSNSVIIRTENGQRAWDMVTAHLEVRDIAIEDIQKAQVIEWRLNHLYFGDVFTNKENCAHDLNVGVPREADAAQYKDARKAALCKLQAGRAYDADPLILQRQMRKNNRKPNPVVQFAKRGMRFLKRILKK